jgi:hypothetical protein
MPDDYLTVAEVAEPLKLNQQTAADWPGPALSCPAAGRA